MLKLYKYKKNHTIIYKCVILALLFTFNIVVAQVGIETDTPEAALDINSTDSVLLVPRIALISSTTAALNYIPKWWKRF
jgi:hypothetical protein